MRPEDPHYQREAAKYDRPIPSREIILELMNTQGKPMEFLEIAESLGLEDPIDQESLRRRLRAMTRDAQLIYNRRKKYLPVSHSDLIAGRIIAHPDGFGFLVPDDGSEDLYLSSRHMRRTMHGDRALVSMIGIDRKGRREGALIEVLEHQNTHVVGRYFYESGIGFVTPDNSRLSQDILIPPDKNNNAQNGQIVVASIIEYPNHRSQPIGKITEILGEHMAAGMEIDIAVRSHALPFEWPTAVQQESDQFKTEIPEADIKGRLDLRQIPLVTIDGEDSRDFDDAVFCERKDGHWVLWVAIADVSHYVKPNTALDQEAINRGTSVYFPNKVIPMLPEILSNGLCSLNPQVDRLCMACKIHISDQGELLSYAFHEAIMHSAARLTYNEVADMVVEFNQETRQKYAHLIDHLDDLYKLFHLLRSERSRRGAIDFETNETRIVYDDDKKIKAIEPTERNDAHKLIEECMILANVCAAKFLEKNKIPAPHRIHPEPRPDSILDLREFLNGLGLSLGGGTEPEPMDYARLLGTLWNRNDAHLVQTVLLRSLSQANYSPESAGHFGLALNHYAHFTSPIRRYPDLLVHRAIRHLIHHKKPDNFIYSLEEMHSLCEHTSMTERRAEDASRDVIAWLKCEYMQDKVGEQFDGIISAVTGFGLFIELEKVFVEGLVHISALSSDYYHFDATRHQLVGESSNKRYRLGDNIKIVVARVDLDDRKIDFVLPETLSGSSRARKKKRKKRKH